MAINKTVTKQTMTLNVEDGVTASGADKTKAHNYSSVRIDATAENIVKAATALSGLISHPLVGIVVTEKAELDQAE